MTGKVTHYAYSYTAKCVIAVRTVTVVVRNLRTQTFNLQ